MALKTGWSLSLVMICCFLVWGMVADAQIYRVFTLPASGNYSRAQLQTDIKNAKNTNELSKIVRLKIPRFVGEIKILVVTNVSTSFWILNEKGEEQTNVLVTGTKGSEQLQRQTDFKTYFFRDTLVVLDSLLLDVSVLDTEDDLPYNGYYFLVEQSEGRQAKIPIPTTKKKELVLSADCFAGRQQDSPFQVSLHNTASSHLLARSALMFASHRLRDEIRNGISELAKEEDAFGATRMQATIASAYLCRYGHVIPSDIVRWLQQLQTTKQ